MDLTFKLPNGCFNYRVCGIIIKNNKILAMKDGNSKYFYLPGGRVQFKESYNDAILREMKEELNIDARIVRPLWMVESFFNEDNTSQDFHELCLYYLIDISNTYLENSQEFFPGIESHKKSVFYWLNIDELENEYIYPVFIRTKAKNLPDSLELLTECQ